MQSSGAQEDVVKTLISLGLPLVEEHQVVPGLVVDAAVPTLRCGRALHL